MGELAQNVTSCLGIGAKEVVDETVIKGTYQVAWDCPLGGMRRSSPGTDATAAPPSDPQDSSSLFRSLDLLGLKLDKRKTLQTVYVIDHIERPSAN
jgi:uncharacterized protein (TIGR03435 family)